MAEDDDADFFESRGDDTDPNPEVVEESRALATTRETTPRMVRVTPQEGSASEWQKHFERGVLAGRKDYRNILLIVLGDSEFTLGVLGRIDRILNGQETPALGTRKPTNT